MALPYQRAVTGNRIKNNGGTVVKGGSVNTTSGPITNEVSLLELGAVDVRNGPKLSTGAAASSGNIGTTKPLSGRFNKDNDNNVFIVRKLATTINGTANTTLLYGTSDYGYDKNPAYLASTRRLDEESWNAVTGAVTKGANAGDLSSFGTDDAALPTADVPGELVYRTGAPLPVQDEYRPRTM